MSMNEMMRDSANQKRERERQERTAAEEIEALKEQTAETHQKLEQVIDAIRTLTEEIRSRKGGGSSSGVGEKVHQLAKVAKQKQTRTAEQLDKIDQLAGQMQRATRQIDERAEVLEETAEQLERAPKPIERSAEKARKEVERAISWLGLKAAGIAVLLTLVTMATTVGAGVWWIGSQGLTVETLTEDEREEMSLGQDTLQASRSWTDEEMKAWKKLMDRTSTTESSSAPK